VCFGYTRSVCFGAAPGFSPLILPLRSSRARVSLLNGVDPIPGLALGKTFSGRAKTNVCTAFVSEQANIIATWGLMK